MSATTISVVCHRCGKVYSTPAAFHTVDRCPFCVWRSVADDPPPEGVVVEVKNNGGAHLKRLGRLWFFPDASMYVYYTPEFWRPAAVSDSQSKTKRG